MAELTKKEKLSLRQEFRKRILGYIMAAFGLVAGLAWNEAIKALIEFIFPLQQDTLLAKFAYAVLLTVVLVLVTVYLTRLFVGTESNNQK